MTSVLPFVGYEMISIGEVICRYRREAGLTQAQLAKLIGVVPPYISSIEHDRKTASIGLLRKICYVLGIAPEVLFWESVKVDPKLKLEERKTIELARVLIRHAFPPPSRHLT